MLFRSVFCASLVAAIFSLFGVLDDANAQTCNPGDPQKPTKSEIAECLSSLPPKSVKINGSIKSVPIRGDDFESCIAVIDGYKRAAQHEGLLSRSNSSNVEIGCYTAARAIAIQGKGYVAHWVHCLNYERHHIDKYFRKCMEPYELTPMVCGASRSPFPDARDIYEDLLRNAYGGKLPPGYKRLSCSQFERAWSSSELDDRSFELINIRQCEVYMDPGIWRCLSLGGPAPKVDENTTCSEIADIYEARVKEAHGGELPINYYRPDCEDVHEQYIDRTLPPELRDKEVTLQDDAQAERNAKPDVINTPDPSLVVISTIIAVLIGGWIADFLPGINFSIFTRVGNILQRIQFQFSPIILVATAGALLGVSLRYAIALAISIFPIWGIAKLFGAHNAIAWAFFVNFTVYAFVALYRLFLGTKSGLAFFEFYTSASTSMGKENRLGNKLFMEALVRNIIIVELVALTAITIFSAGASAWALEKIYNIDVIVGDNGLFEEYWSFFSGTVTQLLLLEIPSALGWSLTEFSLNSTSVAAQLYLIFTKVVVVGGLVEIFIRAGGELQKIAKDVGVTIDEKFGMTKSHSIEPPEVKFRLRPSLARPFAFYIGYEDAK